MYGKESHFEPAIVLRPRADRIQPPQRLVHGHRTGAHRGAQVAQALGLLGAIPCIACVSCGALELLKRRRGLTAPEPQLAPERERPREPGLVAHLLEDLNRRVDGTQDVVPPDAGLIRPVEPEVRERDVCVRRHSPFARLPPALDRLREDRVCTIQLAVLPERSTERRQEAQAARIVERKQAGRSPEQVQRRRYVASGIRPSSRPGEPVRSLLCECVSPFAMPS